MHKNAMKSPNEYEANSTYSRSLAHFDFFWTRNGQSRKKIFFIKAIF
jgi:hypothetical protein